MCNLSVALLHHPVYNKHRQVVTTAFTNLDIHDIARTARTFGLSRYYLVTPSLEQQQLLQRVVNHWDNGWGATYNPDRREALSIVKVAANLAAAVADLQQESDRKPVTIATGAAERPGSLSFQTLRERLQQSDQQHLLLLGTGWGLTGELFEQADCILEPIRGPGEYNHLPVRSALAIMLDRLVSAPHINAT
ncbi:MAG: RNA methyltransferase [Geobacter sp.]|nr:RNA methyltransferase [Geobacter sp.]